MKRPGKWKIVTLNVVFGGLHLLGVAFAMVKPHVAGKGAATVSAGVPLGPAVSRNYPDTGGNTAQSQTRTGLRGLRTATDRRLGDSSGLTARYSYIYGTSSSR